MSPWPFWVTGSRNVFTFAQRIKQPSITRRWLLHTLWWANAFAMKPKFLVWRSGSRLAKPMEGEWRDEGWEAARWDSGQLALSLPNSLRGCRSPSLGIPLWRSFAAPYGYKTKGPDEMISKLLLALLWLHVLSSPSSPGHLSGGTTYEFKQPGTSGWEGRCWAEQSLDGAWEHVPPTQGSYF